MRLFTSNISPNSVQHSYYVTFLYWLGTSLYDRAERIVWRRFDA